MRKSSAANNAASSPPVPARTSRMAFFSSASSLGRSMVFTSSSSAKRRFRTASSSLSASLRISASSPPTRVSSSACSAWVWRRLLMLSTIGVSSLYSLASLTNSPERTGSDMSVDSSAWRDTSRSSFASNAVLSAISDPELGEPVFQSRQRRLGLLAAVEVAHSRLAASQLVLAEDHGRARLDLVAAAHALLQIAEIGQIDREAGAAQLLRQFQRRAFAFRADRHQRNRPRWRRRVGDHQRQALDAAGPADARRFRAAHYAHQPVVTPAGQHRALRSPFGGRELDGGVAIVIEAAHQPWIEFVGNSELAEPFTHLNEEVVRRGGEIPLETRRHSGELNIARILGIENAQGITL